MLSSHFKFQFSFLRFLAIGKKEFLHMKRDKTTYAMIVGVPLMQTILFGLAVNATPKHLPVIFVVKEYSIFTRRLVSAMENSTFFSFRGIAQNEADAEKQLKTFQTSFIVYIPDHFEQDIIRGNKPQMLIEADATDPGAIGAGKNAFPVIVNNVIREVYANGVVNKLTASTSEIVDINVHSVYNPTENSHYTVIPGLLGVILTMSMSLITAQAITREKDQGTMETLLSTPVKPVEVLIGKLLPYILIGYLQMALIMFITIFAFKVPIAGSVLLLTIVTLPYIIANLSMGLFLSAVCKTQVQATQMALFYFLPSMMLSGFAFAFRGMPIWAQHFAEIFPLTHYLRILRGIILKGNGLTQILPEVGAIIIFFFIVLLVGIIKYKRTL